MSFQEKYEKVILGVGITFAVAAGAWAYYQNSSLEETFSLSQQLADKSTPLPGIEEADKLIVTLESPHDIPRPMLGNQPFDIFYAPFLFNKKGTQTAVDIYAAAPFHQDIPNSWFMEHNLGEAFRMSNGADIDSDNDGFSNYEEYLAKTNPNDPASFPNLIAKVQGTELKAEGFSLGYTMEALNPGEPVEMRAEVFNAAPTTKPLWKVSVKPGQEFGEASQANRFKLVKLETKPLKGNDTSVAVVEDQKPEKQGQVYEIFLGKRNAISVIDRSAVLTVNGGPNKGESFTVVEGKTFTIPGDPTKAVYFAEKVDPRAKTLTIKNNKGGDPITINF